MLKPRTLGEGEHLCHCYACCLVTAFAVQPAGTVHGESLPLGGKKRSQERRIPYFMAAFEGNLTFGDPSFWRRLQRKPFLRKIKSIRIMVSIV